MIHFTTSFAFDMSTEEADTLNDKAYSALVDKVVKMLLELREEFPDQKFSCDHCPWILGGESERL